MNVTHVDISVLSRQVVEYADSQIKIITLFLDNYECE